MAKRRPETRPRPLLSKILTAYLLTLCSAATITVCLMDLSRFYYTGAHFLHPFITLFTASTAASIMLIAGFSIKQCLSRLRAYCQDAPPASKPSKPAERNTRPKPKKPKRRTPAR